MTPNIVALLPEYILTIVGVLIMLAEPLLPSGASRKPLGWLAILGTLGAGYASWYQLHLGNITAFSNSIQVDSFSVFFHLLVAAIALVTLLISLDYFEGNASHSGEYFALIAFSAVGMMLMTCATELLVVFVGLEISSISTYIMCGFRKGSAAGSESSIKYFLLGSFATAFFLYGIALAFGATGSTSIAAIAQGLATTTTPRMAFLALAMILIGLGFKVSAAPFHVWTPDVYQGAPSPVVGFMSTAPKAAAFAVLLRITFSAFGPMQHRWAVLLWVLAALSMTVGNLGALLQRDVKRMLAYSSIAHAGYILVAFTALQADGIAAACFYTASYAAMQIGAFAVITQVTGYNEQIRTTDDYTGLGLRRPILAAFLALFLISLIGIPFTGGFFGKFYVFSAAIHANHVWLAVIGLLNSGVACFYYLRLLVALYSRPVTETAQPTEGRSLSVPAGVGLTLAAAATLMLGILPGHFLNLAQRASASTQSVPTPVAAAPVTTSQQ
ncbi:NADH-quinone oxidoreductase subunit N [Edaphobacter dinghuensis]|uniref:NADH-quinone oxidoreductase subunit N n=1 Tax=Edaphobacter dinghuensis TaxID=1560005 RepID=A0A917HE96_9BACT|nr:NADH-quinone oxidoreductase subunit N [Edaphobacter dinghuensis]GGG75652.1 NADH-quinone oxidoreductase subunit N [Edaphobacter dinghuensis]